MRYLRYWNLVLLFLIVFSGCTYLGSKKLFNEGTIEYSIQSEDNAKKGGSPGLMPNKIVVKFHDNNISNTIEGLSGAITLTYINNVESNYYLILLKLLNKKMFYQEPFVMGSPPSLYSGMPNLTIKKTDEIVNFQGFNCQKAIATFNDSTHYSFDILYTNDIKIAIPNANTPFDSISGVMLQFKVKLYKHLMSITATNIRQEKISKDNFTTPTDYTKVPKKTIEDFTSLLQ
jgi:hypothetical protein